MGTSWPFSIQHRLSRLVGWLSRRRLGILKNIFIKWFVRHYDVNTEDIENFSPTHYPTFNAFFTRHLKTTARPIDEEPHAIISPADGIISALGELKAGQLLQAKKHYYDVLELVGGDKELAAAFQGGVFLTAYLAPNNYHRVHMPIDGELLKMIHVPGALISVNAHHVNTVPQLFARNERVIMVFNTTQGPMALIMVGALLVGSIQTVWHGVVTPPTRTHTQSWDYSPQSVLLKKGQEVGHFNMGSTVIALFPQGTVQWLPTLTAEQPLKMGQKIADGLY